MRILRLALQNLCAPAQAGRPEVGDVKDKICADRETFRRATPRIAVQYGQRALHLAENTTSAALISMGDGRFIYELGQSREPTGLARWLYPFKTGELLWQAGLKTPWWWCGLGLPRKMILGPQYDGDVDILAGPTQLYGRDGTPISSIGGLESTGLRGDDRRRTLYEHALHAIRSGALTVGWPPGVSDVVACEVKVSWYDADSRKIKCTHAAEGPRIKGQLKVLLSQGINRVSFLHLVAAKPRGSMTWGSSQPLADAEDAAKALRLQASIYDPAELPACGYITAAIGADSEKTELWSAGTVGPRALQAPAENVSSGTGGKWRAALTKALARCEAPRAPQCYVLACRACTRWKTTVSLIDATCGCGAELLPGL